MNKADARERNQHRIIQYLYGAMDDAQRASFEEEFSNNALLREVLQSEQSLQELIPFGTQPQIDADRMQGNRWVIRKKLRQQNGILLQLSRWWHELRQRPMVLVYQSGFMAVAFVLGFMLAGLQNTSDVSALVSSDSTAVNSPERLLPMNSPERLLPMNSPERLLLLKTVSPLRLVKEEDYEIYQLRVDDYDAASGDIDLSFALASESKISGNVSDPNISRLMTVALRNDISAAARLDTINALQPVSTVSGVYKALIFTLMNDPNPGVRYTAVQALVGLAHVETVREGLRQALREDINMGVRVEAFNALVNYPDDKTLETFRQRINADSNKYIRTRAKSIVENLDLQRDHSIKNTRRI